MAPKRSKGKRIEGDSFDHDLFRSKEVALSFPKFETRCVHKGKYVDLDELEDLEPIRWFAHLEALPLLQIDEPIYPRLVRLFYANLYEDNDSLSTYILGTPIRIFDSTICELIGITEKDRGCYFKGKWDVKKIGATYSEAVKTIFANPNLDFLPKSCEHLLPFNSKILHHIITSIIFPKQFHLDEISQIEIGTMYWIMTGQHNCFGYLIRQHMQDIMTKDTILPYGRLITRILHAYDICIPPDEESIQNDRYNIINKNLLKKLRCTFSNGIWVRQPRRTDPIPTPIEQPETPILMGNESPPPSPFGAAPSAPVSSSEDIIMAELSQIKSQQEQIQNQQVEILKTLRQMNEKIDIMYQHCGLPPKD